MAKSTTGASPRTPAPPARHLCIGVVGVDGFLIWMVTVLCLALDEPWQLSVSEMLITIPSSIMHKYTTRFWDSMSDGGDVPDHVYSILLIYT